MSRIGGCVALALACCGCAQLEAQQTFEPVKLGDLTVTGYIRDRVENWHWFTPTGTAIPKYTYNGTLVRVGLSENLKSFDWMVEMEVPILAGLPSNAVAAGTPGQLGQGAAYYVSNDKSTLSSMIFPSKAFLRVHKFLGGELSSLQLGRFDFQDGTEITPKDPTLASLIRDRVAQRLIGPFGFTEVQRAFDGFHYVYNAPDLNFTLIGAVPTRGVSQTDGWGWVDVAFGYGSVSGQKHSALSQAEWRVFAIYYDDFRPITKTDNRAAAAKAVDHENIRIETWGGHMVDVTKTPLGSVDLMGEVAVQTGRWGVQTQFAAMVDAEGGFQPNMWTKVQPWIRGGYYFGSGDKNPNDSRHGTFFQLLPTPRPYARFPFFNGMNLVDRFGMVQIKPHPRLTFHSEVHSLRLASGADLWYTGGGAFQPWTFGFTGRNAGGAVSLANLYDANVDVTVNSHLTVTPYLGYAAGKSVVRAVYPAGVNGHLAFLEGTYRF